jgi:ribulose 1,5-bisphosphate carboxylase large subunit-like protein
MIGNVLTPIPHKERLSLFAERESIDLNAHLILKLHIDPAAPLDLEEAAIRVLLILCMRTIGVLPYESSDVRIRESGRILELEARTGMVELALPIHVVEPAEGLAHLFSILATPSEYSYCHEYWVENVEFPPAYVKPFLGPRFGVSGIRELFNLKSSDRPLVGVIAKPRRGVRFQSIVDSLREALIGGCDFVCDDLLMVTPQEGAVFEHRVRALVELTREVERQSKEKKAYFVNVSTSTIRALELADEAVKAGADALVVNGFVMGFGGLKEFVDHLSKRVPVITTNMGGGILSRPKLLNQAGKPTGISETVISKLSRLAGADGVHAGTSASECYGATAWGPATRALRAKFHHLYPCFAVAEGDLNLANIWENIKSLGRDVLLEPTSGILGVPGGPRAAAKAFRTLSAAVYPEMSDDEAHETITRTAKSISGMRQILDSHDYRGPISSGKQEVVRPAQFRKPSG